MKLSTLLIIVNHFYLLFSHLWKKKVLFPPNLNFISLMTFSILILIDVSSFIYIVTNGVKVSQPNSHELSHYVLS